MAPYVERLVEEATRHAAYHADSLANCRVLEADDGISAKVPHMLYADVYPSTVWHDFDLHDSTSEHVSAGTNTNTPERIVEVAPNLTRHTHPCQVQRRTQVRPSHTSCEGRPQASPGPRTPRNARPCRAPTRTRTCRACATIYICSPAPPVSVRPQVKCVREQKKDTYSLGRRQISAGKYATPSGTDVQPGGGGIDCAPPSVIS